MRRQPQPIALREFCNEHTQQKAAEIMNKSRSRISQILADSTKEVFIVPKGQGKYTWYQVSHPEEQAS